jgi:hypothetical protein
MISTEHISLNNVTIKRLRISIEETKKLIDEKYKKYTVIMLLLIEFLILFLIYLYEDYGFSVILKLLTIIPIWAIIMITIRYYQKWIPAKKLYRFYTKILNANGYDALRIRSNLCNKYYDGINDYYLFETNPNEIVLLRLQDFTVDMTKFPNNNFIIPPNGLFDIIGNAIINEGQTIGANEDEGYIKNILPAFRLFETGQIMTQNKN